MSGQGESRPVVDPAPYVAVELGAATPRDSAPVRATYTKVAIAFHWLIALCIVAQLALGWRLHDIPSQPARFAAFQLHKSIGLTILLLSVGRLASRLAHSPPAHLPLPRWQRLVAELVHWGFYVVMIGLPLTGWIIISTSKLSVPTMFWGVVRWPALPSLGSLAADDKASWNSYAGDIHYVLALATVAMLAMHVAAVVKHQLVDRDDTFARMAPRARPGFREVRLWGAFVAAVALGLVVTSPSSRPARMLTPASGSAHTPGAAPSAFVPPVEAVTALPAATATHATQKGPAAPLDWEMTRGKLDFTTSWSGALVKGGFGRWDAEILFSPGKLAQSRIAVRIDIRSVTTRDAQQTEALPGSDWFDAAQFPAASFSSTSIRSLGGNRYEARGDLTLRGVKRPLIVPFQVTITGDRAAASGGFSLDRTLFGIGQGEWLATDQIPANVTVSFSLQARTKLSEK
ncbi:MAG: cytochrome [Bradyrhizobium sp.]|nr:cytochrome [Bradyrhizobium sp.]